LTNNHRVLQAFRHSDADKDAPDLYEVTYAGMFGLEPESVTKDQRFIGKVATLALGYGGGENAFAKMARAYGADIPQHEAIAIKTKWRQANPMVQRWWYDLEQTIRKVLQKRISDPVLVSSGLPSVTYRFDGQHLWCGLPSGGEICYPFARIAPAHPSSPFEPAIVYAKATHTPAANRPSNWPTQNLYGGLAAENITQALCRDMLMDAMLEIDEEVDGKLIMTVHDEVVVECRAPIAEDVHDQVKAIMSKVPDWAAGFPLAAEGGIVDRYTKV
jgi:DNA polymerase